jgi:D-serine deaminase-like pyridoxal phosphate-dependent protein
MSSRSWAEVSRILASGDVKGKLAKADLPTPCLVVDLDGLEANLAKMAGYLKAQGRAFRPHAKSHKCAEIARMCVAAGAVGACTAKIGEAEALAALGISGLLITTPMVGRYRVERAVQLAVLRPDTIFVADDAGNLADLNLAAGMAGVRLRVAVDLNVTNRTGVTPGASAVEFVEQIVGMPHLEFVGIQAYAGHCAHIYGFAERKKGSEAAMAPAVETRRLLEAKGIACNWLSGGSTGTYNIDSHTDGITELQPGSFVFMDIDYNKIGGADGNPFYADFANTLTVLTTVYSKPSKDLAVVDAGFKALATDKPFPAEARALPGSLYAFSGDEHGRFFLENSAKKVNLGDRVEFVVPHCDPNVNLYDRMFAVRGEEVVAVWTVDARGRVE